MKTETWEIDLIEAVNFIVGTPFKWGEMDCCILSCLCYDAMTGEDITSNFANKYSGERGALAYQKGIGMSEESFLRDNGAKVIKEGFQNVGDFVIFRTDNLLATAGVCLGVKCLVMDDEVAALVRLELLPPIKTILRL